MDSKEQLLLVTHKSALLGSLRAKLSVVVLVCVTFTATCLGLQSGQVAKALSEGTQSQVGHIDKIAHDNVVATTSSTTPAQPTVSPSPQIASTINSIQSSDEPMVLEIARLTDQLQKVEEQLAVDQIRKAVDTLELKQADQVMRQDAVDAYISGGQNINTLDLLAPSPVPHYYTDVVLRRQQDIVNTIHQDETKAASDTATQLADYQALGTLNSALTKVRQQLEATVGYDPNLSLSEQEIRAQAIAYQQSQSALEQQIQASAASGGPLPGNSALSATEAQQSLQGKYPFGPLLPSQLASAGLVETGATVTGMASWYGPGFDGLRTASGAIYDENGWTCASPNLPFGTMLLVTSGPYGVLVEVNDRGPYAAGRVLDLSHAAAEAIHSSGLANVVAYVVQPA